MNLICKENDLCLAAAALIPSCGGLVVVQRGFAPCVGKWCFPCGRRDGEESLQDTTSREALEECGLYVTVTGLVRSYVVVVPNIQVFINFATPHGGDLRAGGDAVSARIVTRRDLHTIDFAFRQHREIAELWFKDELSVLGVDTGGFARF